MSRLQNLVALILFPMLAFAGDPGTAIGQARQAINEKRFDDAVKLLEAAVPDAERLAEPQHTQAQNDSGYDVPTTADTDDLTQRLMQHGVTDGYRR